MRQKTTASGEHLTLMNDLGERCLDAMWWAGSPSFVSLVAHDGRLLRAEIAMLRDWCDAVLARMETVQPSVLG
jgi:hypothetical protein